MHISSLCITESTTTNSKSEPQKEEKQNVNKNKDRKAKMGKEKKWRKNNQSGNIENQKKKKSSKKQCKEHKKNRPAKKKENQWKPPPRHRYYTWPWLKRVEGETWTSQPSKLLSGCIRTSVTPAKNAQILEVIAHEMNREETKFNCLKNNESKNKCKLSIVQKKILSKNQL